MLQIHTTRPYCANMTYDTIFDAKHSKKNLQSLYYEIPQQNNRTPVNSTNKIPYLDIYRFTRRPTNLIES